jgi:hypothetical protein
MSFHIESTTTGESWDNPTKFIIRHYNKIKTIFEKELEKLSDEDTKTQIKYIIKIIKKYNTKIDKLQDSVEEQAFYKTYGMFIDYLERKIRVINSRYYFRYYKKI